MDGCFRIGYKYIVKILVDCPPRVREIAGSRPCHTKDIKNGHMMLVTSLLCIQNYEDRWLCRKKAGYSSASSLVCCYYTV